MKIQIYDSIYEKSWVYTKALSYLFSPFFDDMSRSKDEFTEEPYQDSVELIAVEDDQVVGLLDIGIYTEEASHSYPYYPGKKIAYFANLAVHPDFQRQGVGTLLLAALKETAVQQNRKGISLTCHDELIPYYEMNGFVHEGISDSTHGGAVWSDMVWENPNFKEK